MLSKELMRILPRYPLIKPLKHLLMQLIHIYHILILKNSKDNILNINKEILPRILMQNNLLNNPRRQNTINLSPKVIEF